MGDDHDAIEQLRGENIALRAELDAAREREMQLRAVLDASYAAVIVMRAIRDPDTGRVTALEIVDVNVPAVEMGRITRAEWIGARTLTAPLGGSELTERLLTVANTGESIDFDLRLPVQEKSGRPCPVHVRGQATRMGDGVVVTAVDLTDHDSLLIRAALDDRLASLGRLAVGIAHELNNPLGWVMTNLEHLRRELRLRAASDELRAAVDDALHGTARMKKIVADLRTGTESTPLDPDGIDLGPILSDSLRMTGHVLHARSDIELDLPPNLPRAIADSTRLGQVLTNLVLNAARAIGERPKGGGRVHIAARHEGDRIVIQVRDNGPGMDERTVARAFEPFFTSDPTRGSGLGLWVSRQLVESFGGTLVVRSTLGVGTVAELSLVAVKNDSHHPTQASPLGHKDPARRRVLVIDDEPLIGRALKRSLPEYEVVYEERASRAIERVRDGEKFDVVLCDLTMPGTDGLSVLQTIASLAPELQGRMALMTGGASDAALQEIATRKLPVVDKPFAPETLLSTLTRLAGSLA